MSSFLAMFRKYFPTWSEVRNKPSTFDAAAHAASHENTGGDEIEVTGLSGVLADEQDAGAIKGIVVDDSAIGDQKVLTFDVGSGEIQYITPAPSGAAINSIQTIDVTFTNDWDVDATIDEVDVSKTMLLFNGHTYVVTGGNQDKYSQVSIRLLNSTTVRCSTRLPSVTFNPRVTGTVLEFASGINNIQRGIYTMTGPEATHDITITEVDTAKAFVSYLNYSSDASAIGGWGAVSILLNATTLRLVRLNPNPEIKISWEVVEFS